MSGRSELRRLQQWFACVVEHPSTAAVAMASRAAKALVPPTFVEQGRMIAASPRRDDAVGMDVYNSGYLLRLVEVMQSDFGAVHHVLGDDAFQRLVAHYLTAHPSRHPNLNQLGVHFASFLRRQRRLAQRGFLAELATLERAVSTAFDAPEFTPMSIDALTAVPQEQWPGARFTANPSVQLLRCRYPVDVFYQAWKEGKPIAVPDEQRSWVLVFRKEDRVWRQRLAQAAHAVLSALVAGKTLGASLALATGGEPVAEWFQDFASEGLFTGCNLTAKKPRSRATRKR